MSQRTTHHLTLNVLTFNIVLKLQVDRDYTLEDITIFIFGQFGLKLLLFTLPLGEFFGGYYPQMNSDIVASPKRPFLGENTSYRPT